MPRTALDQILVLQFECWADIKVTLEWSIGTKDCMLTYRRSNHLEVIWYSNPYFVDCPNNKKSLSNFDFC